MEQFSLDKYLENPSRKVLTRRGNPVRIICTDRKHGEDTLPIVFLEESPDGIGEFLLSCRADGTCANYDTQYDLFFADEELTEFDYAILSIISDHNSHTDSIEAFAKRSSKKLLDLARKEIEKENSKFKPKFTYNEKDYSELANKLIEFRNNTPLCSVSYRDGEGRKIILHYEKEITDLVRKELLKDLPKWKKMPNGIQGNGDFNPTYLVRVSNGYYFTTPCLSWDKDSMYIELAELDKLPKEE